MPNRSLQDLLALIDPDEVARVCADLVRLNTSNPPGNERVATEYVADYLRPAGFSADFLAYPGDPARASVICRLSADGRAPAERAAALMFNGHLDVVPAGAQRWRLDPFSGTVEGGRVWGRGSSDMKGGVAAMLVAAKTLATAGAALRGDLIIAATAGEEAGMVGAAQVAESPALGQVGTVIISEPTDNRLGLAERGVLWLVLTTHGKTAHGSTPLLGRNAINMMRRLLDELDLLDVYYEPHPVLGDFSYSINLIQGGAAQNVVPDQCTVSVDMRTVPGQRHQAIVRQIEALIERMAADQPDLEATVEMHFDLPSMDTPEDDPMVARFRVAASAATGAPVEPGVVRFATEGPIFGPALARDEAEGHVPVIIYGPGNPDLAHQPNEYIEIPKMVTAAQVYVAAAMEMLGS